MVYYEAKDFFADNDRNYVNREEQPFNYNLNRGLHKLSDALEADMAKIQRSLSQIATILQQLAQK